MKNGENPNLHKNVHNGIIKTKLTRIYIAVISRN